MSDMSINSCLLGFIEYNALLAGRSRRDQKAELNVLRTSLADVKRGLDCLCNCGT